MVSEVHKPRRTRGTPLYRIRSYFALSVLGVAFVSGFLFHKSVGAQKLRTLTEEKLLKTAEERKFKKEMMRDFLRKHTRDESD